MGRVYIAGPMTGYPAYNAAAFIAARDYWEMLGWEVVTPLDTDSVVWNRHFGRDFNPAEDVCDYGSPLLGEMWIENVTALIGAGNIAMLSGWQKSKGASIEHAIASALGFPIFDANTGQPLTESCLQEAQRLVHGNRQADYGHPIEDFTRTGKIWAAILGLPEVTPAQVGLCMAGVKISRECNKPKRDNMTDLAGYAETVAMVREKQGAA